MRCPKCGFISFDHLTSCAKCGKDIAEVASELQGTSIKVETPMFLSTALASFADREESFEEHAMESEVSAGIDFSMDEESAAEEAIDMAGAGGDIDFSFESEEAPGFEVKTEEAVDFTIESEEAGTAPAAAEESIEELDIMGTADDEEEEGGLEFDLEDFMEEMDVDKPKSSSSADIDLDFDDAEE